MGAAVVGLLVLSLAWGDLGAQTSLLYGTLAALGWVIGLVGYRLLRARLNRT